MENTNKKEILEFFDDTSKLLSNVAITLGGNGIAQNYVEGVEFWQWLDANYKNLDLSSHEIVIDYLGKKGNHNPFFGKVYEWDWVNAERDKLSNIFSNFDLPEELNNPGFDAVEKSLFGGTQEYQLKSYIGSVPDINENTTPYSIKVITNVESVEGVQQQGYDVDSFMDNESILDRRSEMLESGLEGDVNLDYDFEGIMESVGKGILLGVAIGVGTETISSYRAYKSGGIDAKEYLIRITKAGADKGISSGATVGVMIPINACLTSVGISSLISIPIAFMVHRAIAQPVSAAFGRGEYKTILNEARIYDSSAEMMTDFGIAAGKTSRDFRTFIADGIRTNREFAERRDNFNDSLNDLEKKIGGKL